MAPTLQIFRFVSKFLYSGGWQVWKTKTFSSPSSSEAKTVYKDLYGGILSKIGRKVSHVFALDSSCSLSGEIGKNSFQETKFCIFIALGGLCEKFVSKSLFQCKDFQTTTRFQRQFWTVGSGRNDLCYI